MRPDEQDAMWERIKPHLPPYQPLPCDAVGHDWSDWFGYHNEGRTRDWPEWHRERGECRTCLTCGVNQYRNVEWTQCEEVDTEPWQ